MKCARLRELEARKDVEDVIYVVDGVGLCKVPGLVSTCTTTIQISENNIDTHIKRDCSKKNFQ